MAGIRRAIAAIDEALREESYVRPSRQRPAPVPTTGSCATCKKNKVSTFNGLRLSSAADLGPAQAKCDGDGEVGLPCSRCISAGTAQECIYPLQVKSKSD